MTLFSLMQTIPAPDVGKWFGDLVGELFKLAIAGVVGFVLSNLTIGRKLSKSNAALSVKITEATNTMTQKVIETRDTVMAEIKKVEDASDQRTTRLEHEMWGAQGNAGVRQIAEKTSEVVSKLHLILERVETKLNISLDNKQGK